MLDVGIEPTMPMATVLQTASPPWGLSSVCAPGRIRTCDKWIRSPLLYPLSYRGVAKEGFEPSHPFGYLILSQACLPFHHSALHQLPKRATDQIRTGDNCLEGSCVTPTPQSQIFIFLSLHTLYQETIKHQFLNH